MAAADVAKFSAAIDKVYKTYSTQDLQFDHSKEGKGLTRSSIQFMEAKFQQQLQRARAAFLQEFRNHSVVVETEVRKIRQELTLKLEEKYGEKIREQREQLEEAVSTETKLRDELARQKSLTRSLETDIRELKRRDAALGQKEKLQQEILQLTQQLEGTKQENADLTHTLKLRDDLIAQLRRDLAALDAELKSQVNSWGEERDRYELQMKELRAQMQQDKETFREALGRYQEKYEEYRAKTSAQLQIADILNARRTEALANMEEERQRHIRARVKPTKRIGIRGMEGEEEEDDEEDEDGEKIMTEPYEFPKDAQYRKDEMGMDTAWRDYQMENLALVPPARKPRPQKFSVERPPRGRWEPPTQPGPPPTLDSIRGRAKEGARRRGGSLGAHAPTATDTPRQGPHMRALPMGQATVTLPPQPT